MEKIIDIQAEIGEKTREAVRLLKILMEKYFVRMEYRLHSISGKMGWDYGSIYITRKGGQWDVYWGEEMTLIVSAPFQIKGCFLSNAKKILEAYQQLCFESHFQAQQSLRSFEAFEAHVEAFEDYLNDPVRHRVVGGQELLHRLTAIERELRRIKKHSATGSDLDFVRVEGEVNGMKLALETFLGKKR